MKTAGRGIPNRWAIKPGNRAQGALAQNRSCSFTWAAKQEKFQPQRTLFLLTSSFIELIGRYGVRRRSCRCALRLFCSAFGELFLLAPLRLRPLLFLAFEFLLTLLERHARGFPQVTGASIQLKGRIRRSFAFDAFPCQPQLAYGHDSSSSPNSFIASASDSDTLPHFFCRLMLCPLGHSKTIR